MENIPGLFGRTNKGKIFRYANVENEVYKMILVPTEQGYYNWEKYWLSKDENFVLIGENITDVLKEGDYVNGCLVYQEKEGLAIELSEHMLSYELIKNIDIETIVTKEDMERITYKENSRLWLQENIK